MFWCFQAHVRHFFMLGNIESQKPRTCQKVLSLGLNLEFKGKVGMYVLVSNLVRAINKKTASN